MHSYLRLGRSSTNTRLAASTPASSAAPSTFPHRSSGVVEANTNDKERRASGGLVLAPRPSTTAKTAIDMDDVSKKTEEVAGTLGVEPRSERTTAKVNTAVCNLPVEAPQKLPSIPAPYEASKDSESGQSASAAAPTSSSVFGGDGKELMFIRDVKTGKMVPLSEIDVFSMEHDEDDDDEEEEEDDDDDDDGGNDYDASVIDRSKIKGSTGSNRDILGALSSVFNTIATATTATVEGYQRGSKKSTV